MSGQSIDRRSVLAWAGAMAGGLPAIAQPSVAEPLPIAGRGMRLVKNWDFGQNLTDTVTLRNEFFTRFIYDNGQLDHLNDEWERYRDNDNHRFEGGALSLVAQLRGALAPGGIESGMLRSRWSGQYGYYECRMKVPVGRGLWPAFWLNPQDARWPPEIDVVEIVNDGNIGSRQSFHFVHPSQSNESSVVTTRLNRWGAWQPGFDFADEFHRFAVDWSPGRVRHYVDDVLVVDRNFVWKHVDGSDGGAAHVLVNLAVGGHWPGPPTSPAIFPAALRVAYVRVWQAPA